MFCEKCGQVISDDANFCFRCGHAVARPDKNVIEEAPVQKIIYICPNCGKEFEAENVFCDFCGFKLVPKTPSDNKNVGSQNNAHVSTNPPVQQLRSVQNVQQFQPRQNTQNISTAQVSGHGSLLELNMMSKYIGEPNVGVAKATGKLIFYRDRLEFEKTFGNSAGNALGAVGMLIARNKMQKEGKIEVYPFDEIETAYKGKYMGMMPTLVIKFKNGEIISFAGIKNGERIDYAINTINNNKGR